MLAYSTLTFLDFDKDRNVINEASMISGCDSDYRNGTMDKWKSTGKIYRSCCRLAHTIGMVSQVLYITSSPNILTCTTNIQISGTYSDKHHYNRVFFECCQPYWLIIRKSGTNF